MNAFFFVWYAVPDMKVILGGGEFGCSGSQFSVNSQSSLSRVSTKVICTKTLHIFPAPRQIMSKLRFRRWLISQVYPIHKISENLMHESSVITSLLKASWTWISIMSEFEHLIWSLKIRSLHKMPDLNRQWYKDTDRQTDRQTDRHNNIQKQRHTDNDRHRQTDILKQWYTETHRET